MSRPEGRTPRSLAAGRRFRLLRVYRTTFRVLLSYGVFHLAAALRGAAWAAQRAPAVHRANARRVLAAVLAVQGLFIKVGQLVSMLAGFLPADFRGELAALQDRIPPRPWAEIRQRLVTELGAEPEALFAEVDHRALAAASLAQVHAATLHDGRRVAVKVQHLGIEELARLDLTTVRRILGLVGLFTGARGLGELFDEVRGTIEDELDFRREADHAEEIAARFADDAEVHVPPVVRELSTERVLVTAFVDGVKVTDLDELERRGVDRAALAERILRAYCTMIFEHGVYHADPHPGNLLVHDDGSVSFVDFGAVGRLSPAMRAAVPRLLEAVLRRDREEVLRTLGTLGFVARPAPGGAGDDVAQRVIDYVFSRFLADLELDDWDLSAVRFDPRLKMEMLADFRRLDLLLRDLTAAFRVPREWILLLRTLFLLLGLATTLDPHLRPARVVRPYLEGLALGAEGDWLRLAGTLLRDLAATSLALPGDVKRFLDRAERGETTVQVGGLREGASLLYALGHQVICSAFALACGGLAYVARLHGDGDLAGALAAVSAAALLLLAASLWRARRWSRRLRRGL